MAADGATHVMLPVPHTRIGRAVAVGLRLLISPHGIAMPKGSRLCHASSSSEKVPDYIGANICI